MSRSAAVSETAGRPRRARIAPEAALVVAALLCLALLPVRVLEIYSGLPAHPLFLHVPVILIPTVALGALVLIARPRYVANWGLALAALAVITLAGTILTAGAGKALRVRIFGAGRGPDALLIAKHAHAANILEVLLFAFVIALIVMVASDRARRERGAFGSLGSLLAARGVGVGLKAAVAVLAVASVVFVVHTGDLGAKAVWHDRLNGGGPGGGFQGSGFGSG